MFDVIKANVTCEEAQELYPNNNIVLLGPTDGNDDTKGDVIYVGDAHGAYLFTEPIEPPTGYLFYMLRGLNLREFAPIEVYNAV
jgi:hypothetical protein